MSNIERAKSFLSSGKVDENERLQIMADLIGYERMPPTIEEVLDSDEFLNKWYGKSNLYPYWRQKLIELFPNPIETTAMVVVAKGAIGTGKSFFSQAIVHYDLIKLSCLSEESAHAYFGLTEGTTPWTCRYFNVNKDKASDIFITPTMNILSECPYWQEWRQINKKFLPCNMSLYPSSRPNHILSEALYSCVISEVNFFRSDVAERIVNTALGRMTSRFEAGKLLFNHCIIDSSDTYEDSVVEQFIKRGAYSDCIKVFHTTSWEAKAHKGVYFNEGEFFVYLGDSNFQPFIIDDNTDKSELDPDLIMRVPRELLAEFKSDIVKALQDKAGVSVKTGMKFFANRELLMESFDIDYPHDDVINLDFFDKISIMDLINKKKLFLSLDEHKPLYIRLDMGLTNDKAGIAIVQHHSVKEVVVGKETYRENVFTCPFAIGLTRPQGQETPFYKIEDFILELSQKYEIKMFSTDQYQSSEIRQNIYFKSNKTIPTSLLSVDSNDRAYSSYKRLVSQSLIHCCKNPLLMFEMKNLNRAGRNKIDHDPDKSKDISDAVVGAVYTAIQDGYESANVNFIKTKETYLNALRQLNKVPFRGVIR